MAGPFWCYDRKLDETILTNKFLLAFIALSIWLLYGSAHSSSPIHRQQECQIDIDKTMCRQMWYRLSPQTKKQQDTQTLKIDFDVLIRKRLRRISLSFKFHRSQIVVCGVFTVLCNKPVCRRKRNSFFLIWKILETDRSITILLCV